MENYLVIYKDSTGLRLESTTKEQLNNRLMPDEVGNCYYGRTDRIWFFTGGLTDLVLSNLDQNVVLIIKGEIVTPTHTKVEYSFE